MTPFLNYDACVQFGMQCLDASTTSFYMTNKSNPLPHIGQLPTPFAPALTPVIDTPSHIHQLEESISNGLTSTKDATVSLGDRALSLVPEFVSNAAAFGYTLAASAVGSGYQMGSDLVNGAASFAKAQGNTAYEYAETICKTVGSASQYLPSGKTALIGAVATGALAALFIGGYKVYTARAGAEQTTTAKELFLKEVQQNDLQGMNRASNGLGGFKGQIVSRALFAFALFANMVNVVKNVALLAFATVKAPFSVAARQEAKACAKSIGLGILNVPVSVVGTLVPELGRLAFEGELKLATGVVPARTDRQIFSA